MKIKVRLVHDPKVTAAFQIEEEGEQNGQWLTLRMFSNEMEARNLLASIKKHGTGKRVLEVIEVEANHPIKRRSRDQYPRPDRRPDGVHARQRDCRGTP